MESAGGNQSRVRQFLFREESRGQAIRLTPDTLKPSALVLRQVEQEDIEAHFAMGSNGPTLTRFIINPDRSPSRLGKAYSHTPYFEGALFSGQVLDLAPMQVALSTVYLEEQAILDPGMTREHAWSLSADTQMLSGQLQFYSEYARSRDSRRLPAAMPVQDDDAYKLQLNYSPNNAILREFSLDWTMGIKHQRVGPFFRSPATPNGRRDVSLVEAFTHLGWRGLILDTLLVQEKSNFASPHLGSPQQNRWAQLKGEYRFFNLDLPSWLGVPSLNLLLSKRNKEAFGQGTSNAKLEAGFSHQSWSWNLSQTLSWHESEINPHFSGRSRATTMETRLGLFDKRLNLAPVFQYRHYAVEPNINEQWLVGIDTCAVFIPERLKGQLRTDVKRTWNNGMNMQRTYSTRGSLNWQLTRRKARSPIVRFFLEGRYEAIVNQMNSATALIEDYLMFIGVALN